MAFNSDTVPLLPQSSRTTPNRGGSIRDSTPVAVVLPKIAVLSKDNVASGRSGLQTPTTPGYDISGRVSRTPLVSRANPPALGCEFPEVDRGTEKETENHLEVQRKKGQNTIIPAIQELSLDITGEAQLELKHTTDASKTTTKTDGYLKPKLGYKQTKNERRPRTQYGLNRDESNHGPRRGRPTTSTWPSIQYKLWIDTSNLSFHRLSSDERVLSVMRARENQTKRCMSISRDAQSDSRRMLVPGIDKRTPIQTGSMSDAVTDLYVGTLDTWKVDSSHVQKTRPRQSSHRSKYDFKNKLKHPAKATSSANIINSSPGLDGFATGNTSLRLPSRLGRHSLDCFLKNSNDKSDMMLVKPKVASDILTDRNEAVGVCITPSCSQRSKLLQLRGFVRNPVGYRENARKKGLTNQGMFRLENAGKAKDKFNGRSKNQMSFRIPQEKISDIPSPSPPELLDDTCHIMTYISSKS